jgi:S1-C subfamily serine protease
MKRTIVGVGAAMLLGAVLALVVREGFELSRGHAQQPAPNQVTPGRSFGSRLFGQPPVANDPSFAPAVPPTVNLAPTNPALTNPNPQALAVPTLNGPTIGEPLPGETLQGDDLTPEERVNVAVYENCNRSVVNINTKIVTERLLFEVPSEGAGSGLVLDRAGHILTNQHVIDEAKEINVTLYDGQTYPAALVGRDPQNDIAVLRIDAPAAVLFPVTLGDSTRLRVGQKVYAIGNPFGLERTLTLGIVSSLNRTLPSRTGRTIKSIIQIDAAINPGNSGGPLLDSQGRLIGLNTAIASKTGQSAGVGFAIPVNTVARVVPQLIERGQVIRPEVGIQRVYQTERGLIIAGLLEGGPAEQAGLRGPRLVKQLRRQGPFVTESSKLDMTTADMIVAVNGQRIKTADDFLSLVEVHPPGAEVEITVVREGRETNVRVRLGVTRE